MHPRAVRIARRHGLRLGTSRPVDVTRVVRGDDLVVAVCDRAHEQLAGHRLHWSVPDPAGRTVAEIRPIRDGIERRVRRLLAELGAA